MESDTHRYKLSRDLGGELQNGSWDTATWVMFNPSTATEMKDDPTIRAVKAFTVRLGCRYLKVVNLLPRRATEPNDLQGLSREEMFGDKERYANAIVHSFKEARHIVFGWGTLVEKPFLREHLKVSFGVLDIVLNEFNKDPVCVNLSEAGHPCHPLYQKRDSAFVDFNLGKYINIHGLGVAV